IATLTVIANESYTRFADALQKEYKEAGVEIGRVRRSEFSKMALLDNSGTVTDDFFGYQRSLAVWNHLQEKGFIDKDGTVTSKFQPKQENFKLDLPTEFAPYEEEITDLISDANIEKHIKQASKRRARKLNKQLYPTPEFEEFWETISRKTTYR